MIPNNTDLKMDIKRLIEHVEPFDDLENRHIKDSIEWVNSGKELFRIKKPDVPNKHLVSYFVLYDKIYEKVLLVDHKKAQLWLPPGGHVDPNEHPNTTVERECLEELRNSAHFLFREPIFVTSTLTVGLTPGHIDGGIFKSCG